MGHLAAAAVAQVAAAALLVTVAGDLAEGRWYGPLQLGVVHLYGVAMLTVAIVGALHQLLPVLVRQAIPGPRVAALAGGAVLAGGVLLAAGLAADVPALIATGGAATTAGILAVAALAGTALARAARARSLGDAGTGVALALGWLALVGALGLLLVASRVGSPIDVPQTRLLSVHAGAALLGWVGGAILAVSLRLVPMFALSHRVPRRAGRAAVGIWHAGTAVLVLGLAADARAVVGAGLGLLTLSVLAAAAFLAGALHHRRRRVEAPLAHLAIGLGATLAASAALGAGIVGGGAADPRALTVAGAAVLVALGAGTTSGHMFKVVPMVVWIGRHSSRAGTPGVPTLAQMYPRGLAAGEQALFLIGTALLLAGIAVGAAVLATLGAAALTAAAIAVLVAVAATIRGPRRAPIRAAAPRPATSTS